MPPLLVHIGERTSIMLVKADCISWMASRALSSSSAFLLRAWSYWKSHKERPFSGHHRKLSWHDNLAHLSANQCDLVLLRSLQCCNSLYQALSMRPSIIHKRQHWRSDHHQENLATWSDCVLFFGAGGDPFAIEPAAE
jgi:hypothetical protein